MQCRIERQDRTGFLGAPLAFSSRGANGGFRQRRPGRHGAEKDCQWTRFRTNGERNTCCRKVQQRRKVSLPSRACARAGSDCPMYLPGGSSWTSGGWRCSEAARSFPPHVPATVRSTMILRDPRVHGLVSFEAPEQRIVHPLSLGHCRSATPAPPHRGSWASTSLAYPGADHTRFSHAIGTAHVMSRLLARIVDLHGALPPGTPTDPRARRRSSRGGSFCTTLASGSVLHLFEESMPEGPRHETWSSRIVRDSSTEVHRSSRRIFRPKLPAARGSTDPRQERTHLSGARRQRHLRRRSLRLPLCAMRTSRA